MSFSVGCPTAVGYLDPYRAVNFAGISSVRAARTRSNVWYQVYNEMFDDYNCFRGMKSGIQLGAGFGSLGSCF